MSDITSQEKVGINHNSQTIDNIPLENIQNMRSPSEMGIICIDITNKCDLACSNCTRLLANQDYFWDMTLENFKTARNTLKDYKGVVVIIGGNPCMHPKFDKICKIFAELRPDKQKRGLWTNNFFKHEKISTELFGVFNLNTHGDSRSTKSLKNFELKGGYHPDHSHHAPILTAIKDLYKDKQKMWDAISKCDVNHNWSASIVQNKGKLRAYFCEVAASFDLARGTDNGLEVNEGWWQKKMIDYENQINYFCPGCGIAAKLKGSMDFEEIDTYSKSNEDLAKRSQELKGRNIFQIESLDQAKDLGNAVTSYSIYLKKNYKYRIKKLAWKASKIVRHLFD